VPQSFAALDIEARDVIDSVDGGNKARPFREVIVSN